MKKLIVVVIPIFILFSCKKEEEPKEEPFLTPFGLDGTVDLLNLNKPCIDVKDYQSFRYFYYNVHTSTDTSKDIVHRYNLNEGYKTKTIRIYYKYIGIYNNSFTWKPDYVEFIFLQDNVEFYTEIKQLLDKTYFKEGDNYIYDDYYITLTTEIKVYFCKDVRDFPVD